MLSIPRGVGTLVGLQHEGPWYQWPSTGKYIEEGKARRGTCVLVYPTRRGTTYRSDAFTAPPMFVVLQYRADQSLRPIASLSSHGVAGCPTSVGINGVVYQFNGVQIGCRTVDRCNASSSLWVCTAWVVVDGQWLELIAEEER